MTEIGSRAPRNAIASTGEIVAAYVAHNALPAAELPGLIGHVHAALAALANGRTPTLRDAAPTVEQPTPAQVRNSVRDEGLVSFLDGKTYKTLKRHLRSHGLDPRDYRERYGLPADYPMVAPDYAARRSALAKAIGLGRPGAQAGRERRKPEGSRRTAA